MSKNIAYQLQQKKQKQVSKKKSFLFVVFAFLTAGIISSGLWLFKDLPSPKKLASGQFPTSTQIFDRNNILLYEIYAEQDRTPVELSEIPEHLKNATIAIEDKDFYQHSGLDFRGISRAVYKIIFQKQVEGGSTITQQLIKNVLLSSERTIKRKLREAVLAWLTETIYSKDEILEMYFNHVPYGGTAYGIEQASKHYFGKNASELNLAEASLLAGLPAAPTRFSPFGANPQLAKQRQKQVLRRMVEDGYIPQAQADQSSKQKLEYQQQTTNIKAPHFVMYVKEKLVEEYGQHLVEQGGLRVKTTLDWEIQQFAEQVVASQTAQLKNKQVSNGAALVTNPKNGQILAMVGSKDYFAEDIDGNVNLTTSLRQPGSSIKPINYATGLINKHTPASLFLDIPTCFKAPGQPEIYCPHNYDNSFHGPVTMRSALANSYNIPAVKMLSLNGIQAMMATAKMMGISSWEKDSSRYGLSLTLGGGEVKMTEMAVAFGVFANLGEKIPLNPLLEVKNYKGESYQQQSQQTRKVISPEVAYLINDILSDNQARTPAFGPNSQLKIPSHRVAVKTGTTDHPQGPRDNWTIGYTNDILTASWVGNNDNSPMNPNLVSGITGAAPIWNKIMNKILRNKKEQFWEQPDNLVEANVCTWSAQKPGEEQNCSGRKELFIEGTEKKQTIAWVEKKEIWIDKETNRPPEEEKKDNLELKEHLIGHSPFVKEYCLSCPHEDEKSQIVEVDENLFPNNHNL